MAGGLAWRVGCGHASPGLGPRVGGERLSVIGVDVGGTFTDLVTIEPATGAVRIAKVPTTPDNQAFGVLAALEAAGADPGPRPASTTAPPPPPTLSWSARSPAPG